MPASPCPGHLPAVLSWTLQSLPRTAWVSAILLLAAWSPVAEAQTVISGTITENQTWSRADSPFEVHATTVAAGVTITIESGVVLRVHDYQTLAVHGSMIANGTTTDPIVFTSFSGAEEGDPWSALRLTNGNGAGGQAPSTFRHCVFEGGGYWWSCTVEVSAGAPATFENCTFQHGRDDGLRLYGTSPEIRDCVFRNNANDAVQLQSTPEWGASYPVIANTTFEGSGRVHLVGDLHSSGTLYPAPYLVSGATGQVLQDVQLQIEAGTELAFANWTSWTVQGNLIAAGTSLEPITFTSLSGAGTGDPWGGLRVLTGSGRASTFDHCAFEGGGYWYDTLVEVAGPADVTFRDCRFDQSRGYGLRLRSASPTLTRCSFSGNSQAIRLESTEADGASYPLIRDTQFHDGNKVHLAGDIHSSGTLVQAPYLIDGATGVVHPAVELIVEPGATFTVAPWTSWTVWGNLLAEGTAELPITWTPVAPPGAGDPWGGLRVIAGSGRESSFQHCIFEGGGYWYDALVDLDGPAMVSFTDCLFDRSRAYGLRLRSASPTLTRCQFTGNGNAIRLESSVDRGASYPLIRESTFAGAERLHLAGDIHSSGVLSQAPYLVDGGTGSVAPEATVEIEPGSVFSIADFYSWTVHGNLVAPGTPDAPIVFTSLSGADQGNPWRAVRLSNGNGSAHGRASVFEHCIFEGGGYWHDTLLQAYGGAPVELRDSIFRLSIANGVHFDSGSGGPVTRCEFLGNAWHGLRLTSTSPAIEGCQFFGNGSGAISLNGTPENGGSFPVYAGNQFGLDDKIEIGSDIHSSGAWPDAGTPYLLRESRAIRDVADLAIDPGVTVQFANFKSLVIHGSLSARGSGADPVFFTSDDADKQPDQWGGLVFTSDRTKPSLLHGCHIEAGGYWYGSLVQVNGAPEVGIDGCLLQLSSHDGIQLLAGGNATVQSSSIHSCNRYGVNATGNSSRLEGCDIFGHGSHGLYSLNSSVVLRQSLLRDNGGSGVHAEGEPAPAVVDSVVSGNTSHGINNRGPVTLAAPNNWWGSPTGPFHPALNPEGTGNQVSDRVEFRPFRTASRDIPKVVAAHLQNGVAVQGTFTNQSNAIYYAATVAAGQHLSLTFDDGNDTGFTQVYLSRGSFPTPVDYQVRHEMTGADQSIFVPNAGPGTWYILVVQFTAEGSSSYTMRADIGDIFVHDLAPGRHANNVPIVMTVSGAGFAPGVSIDLLAGANTFPAQTVELDSPTRLTATFSANSVPVGVYDVRVSVPGKTPAVAPAAFEAVDGGQPRLVTNLVVPQQVGYHQLATLFVEFANEGTVAMPAPLLMVTAFQNGEQRGLLTLDRERLTSGFWTSAVPDGFAPSVQILASGKTPGVLQPGESGYVPVYYAGWLQPWDFTYPPIEFGLATLTAEDDRPIDWTVLRQSLLPNRVDPEAYDIIWNNFRQGIGNRVGDFVAMLGENASFLGRQGHRITDVDLLTRYEFQQAEGFAILPFAADVFDIEVSTPGLPLTFQRFYPTWTSGRLRLGDLGRGWRHNWSHSLHALSDGTIEIRFPRATRRFQPDSRSGYLSAPGDHGVLRQSAGEFILTEPEGLRYAFAAGKLSYLEDRNGVRITASYTDGHLSRLQHSNGRGIDIQHDPQGRIIGLTDPYNRQTTLRYEGANLAEITRPNGASMLLGYFDASAGAKAHALQSIGEGTTRSRYFDYDSRGRLAETGFAGGAERTTYGYDSAGTVTTTDALGRTSTFLFDQHGEPGRMTNPLGATVVLRRNSTGALEEMIDPMGSTTSYTYDSSGRLTTMRNPVGAVQRLGYDRSGALTGTTDPLGFAKTFTRDSRGNVTKVTYPDGTSRSISYGPAGEVTSLTNGRGQTVAYSYNANGYLERKEFPDGTACDYFYDSKDRIVRIVDPTGETLLAYDDSDRITRATYPDGHFLEYEYDAYDRRTLVRDDGGREVHYQYDEAGRLAGMRDESDGVLIDFEYDPTGLPVRETFGDGAVNTYAYNGAGLLIAEVQGERKSRPKDTKPPGTYTTEYDLNGRSVSSSGPEGVWTMGYDPLGRLTDATLVTTPGATPQTFNYQYDLRDRWIQTTVDGVQRNHTTNPNGLYTRAGDTTYTYDADSNMTSQRTGNGDPVSYGYDAENRVVSVSSSATSWTGHHDGLGNLRSFDENGSTTVVLPDVPGGSGISHEYGSDGSLLSWHVQGLRTHTLLQHPASFISAAPRAPVEPPVLRAARYQSSTVDRRGVPQVPSSELRAVPHVEMTEVLSDPAVNQLSNWLGIGADGSILATMGLKRFATWPGRFRMDPRVIVRVGGNSLRVAATYGTALFTIAGGGYEFYNGYHQGGTEGSNKMWHGGGYAVLGVISVVVAAGVAPAAAPFVLGAAILATVSDLALETGVLDKFWEAWDWAWGLFQSEPSLSSDPNQKLGPAGFGAAHYVGPGALLPYRIDFENDEDATAPAQVVMVTDPLSDSLDWSTFTLTETGFGDHLIPIPPGSQQFETTVFLNQDDKYLEVTISIRFDPITGIITAIYSTTDVDTGLPPEVRHGFLPPEDGTGRGLGHFSYTIRADGGLPTGTEIRNVATITFDFGEVIDTNQVDPHDPSQGTDPDKEALVTIDAEAPASSVSALPATSPPNFTVSWTGDDSGRSGVARYSVFVREDGGPFQPWLLDTTAESAPFTGVDGRHYEFHALAVDRAGNEEAAKTVAEASTTVDGSADPYGDWLALHFTPSEIQAGTITAFDADPDGDARDNFAEFSFVTDPRQPDEPSMTFHRNGARYSIIWIRRKSGALYQVEQSTGLENWSPAVGVQETILAGDADTETVQSSVSTGGLPSGFLRVQALAP